MKHYFILTYGCQMNTADSERLSEKLESEGFISTSLLEKADLIIINSCMVRQAAEDTVYGFGKEAQRLKQKNPKLKIIVTGCMIGVEDDRPKPNPIGKLKKKMPWVDDFWPIGKIGYKVEVNRIYNKSALIPISTGCNNFCTYCVVPYTRGREKSRTIEEIVEEVKNMESGGAEEVTLLGQNVNSYGKDLKPESNFSELLSLIHGFEGIKKIKFMTAHPKDMTDELINTIADLPKVDRYLHFPVQAGDDEVLRRMNRGYKVSDYKNLVKKIKTKIPEAEIGTDIIVGFPGETEAQFENTAQLMRDIEFDNAYIAMYSPRKGTVAYGFKDDITLTEKKRRHKILLDILRKHKKKRSQK